MGDQRKGPERNFIGGLVEGINFPVGRNTPLIDLRDCNDVIIVDREYFLKNMRLIQGWASKEFG
jgi:hypothetical protein